MDCKCGGKSKVVSTVKKGVSVFRQRCCLRCGKKWFTEEKENNSIRVAYALSNRQKWSDDTDWELFEADRRVTE